VLDNCEHVIDAAATMAEALLRANPAAQVVVTSREPLKAEGEWIYPVPLLAVPTRDAEDGRPAAIRRRAGSAITWTSTPRSLARISAPTARPCPPATAFGCIGKS
jgi:predicted ATPase